MPPFLGGSVPPPTLWWAFYVPAALFAALGSAFAYGNASFGGSTTTRMAVVLFFGTAAAWLAGAVRGTVLRFRRPPG